MDCNPNLFGGRKPCCIQAKKDKIPCACCEKEKALESLKPDINISEAVVKSDIVNSTEKSDNANIKCVSCKSELVVYKKKSSGILESDDLDWKCLSRIMSGVPDEYKSDFLKLILHVRTCESYSHWRKPMFDIMKNIKKQHCNAKDCFTDEDGDCIDAAPGLVHTGLDWLWDFVLSIFI